MDQPAIDVYALLLELNGKISRIETNIEQLKKDAETSSQEDDRLQQYVTQRIDKLAAQIQANSNEIEEIKNNKARKLEYWFDRILKYIVWGAILWALSVIANKLNLQILMQQ